MIAAAISTTAVYVGQYRPDQQIGPAEARAAVAAATAGTIAVLSYSTETVATDIATAKSHLSGEFLDQYTQFTEQIVTPAVNKGKVKTTASVVRSAVSDLEPDRAVVLLFINQTTASADRPDPTTTPGSVSVTLRKSDNSWRITQFEPA